MPKSYENAKMKMHAYVIMLHLRSQGWTNFTELYKLLGWARPKNHYTKNCLGHIEARINYLGKEWGEDIPKINAFAFKKETKCTDYICKTVFGTSGEQEQPCPKEIAEYAAKIAAYPKWDQVVAFLRREAFDAAE